MQTTQAYALLLMAQEQLPHLEAGEEFTVSDLFYGYEWKRIQRNVKATLGSLFYLTAMKDPHIEIIEEKSTKNQQRYRKV